MSSGQYTDGKESNSSRLPVLTSRTKGIAMEYTTSSDCTQVTISPQQEKNNQLPRDFKGIWIPREIWIHDELKPLEKMLWAEIDSLFSEKYGGCFGSNEYFAKFFNVSERYIREMISNLKKYNFIEDVNFNGRTRVMRALYPKDQFLAERNHSSGQTKQGGTTVPGKEEPQFRESYIESKALEKSKEIAQSAKKPLHLEVVFSFENRKFENISSEEIKNWKEIYSACNILLEIKKMEEWCLSNPSKSKGKKLWRKFITNWLQKNHEELTNKQAYQKGNSPSVDRRTKNIDGTPVKSAAEGLF